MGKEIKSKEIDKYNVVDDQKASTSTSKQQNIKIINGSKVIGQIDHLCDVEHFEDAIFLTEQALKIMDESFGFNFVEKIHNFLPNPMYFKANNLKKNHVSNKVIEQDEDGGQKMINVNYNININFNINVNGNAS